MRALSSSIYYLLTRHSPIGRFHRNRSLIAHTVVRGRGRYVLIHEDGRVETFVVGSEVEKGERAHWVVQGGVWKASVLEGGCGELLVSEVVIPGFDAADREFLGMAGLVEAAEELRGLVRAGDR